MSSVELPFDIIECILDHLDDNTCALKNCCLINRTVFPAAARSLYRHVVIRNHYWYLDSKKNRKLDSALLSRYSHYVRSMKIESDVANSDDIRRAFQTFRNVRSINLDHCNIFNDHFDTELLELLSKHVSLDELDLAIPYTSQDLPDTRRTLAKITTLRKLGIAWPTDGLIQMVAQEWAKKLTVLTDLSLRGRDRTWSAEFILQMKSIKCLNLGGILQDVDDLPILAQLPHLRELHLRYNPICYYNPKIHPKFSLYSLTVEHEISSTRSHNIRLCRWVIRIIGTSSHLHSLSLFEGVRRYYPDRGSFVSYDPLIDHLIHKHANHLQSLNIRFGLIKRKTLHALCQGLPKLEGLSFAADKSILWTFQRSAPLLKSLRKVQIILRNMDVKTLRTRLSEEAISRLIKDCPELGGITVANVYYQLNSY